MDEKLKSYLKYFMGLAILVYVLVSIILKEETILNKADLSVTLTMILVFLYSELLWKINPIEKTPKIYGKYQMKFISTYDDKDRDMIVTIKQSLFSTRVHMETKESYSDSISFNILINRDNSELIYAYQNIPNSTDRNHSQIHFGTCRLYIVKNMIKSGQYYTDIKTTGQIKKIKKIKY